MLGTVIGLATPTVTSVPLRSIVAQPAGPSQITCGLASEVPFPSEERIA
jgi:hypothetical protein